MNNKITLQDIKYVLLILITAYISNYAQNNERGINNLIHDSSYITSRLGDVPNYKKIGNGKINMILIPGLGFDGSVFDDFLEHNKTFYTMYSITIPGFGNTKAAPMPGVGTSYGEHTWINGVVSGILKLIEQEKIYKPIIVAHFTVATQVALKIGIDFPELLSGMIIMGGPAKMIFTHNNEVKDLPLDQMIYVVDNYTAPVWFKSMQKEDWDEGNYLPEVYSVDSLLGKSLWKEVATVPVPIMVRYLCEYIAMDLKAELGKIKCPTLVLRPTFNQKVLSNPINNYVSPQFIETWNNSKKINNLVQVEDISASACFVWKDNPKLVYDLIRSFSEKIQK